jgi:hypothetical protein
VSNALVCNTGKRRRGNPEALARLAKRAKPAAFDDEGPADEPQVGYQRVHGFMKRRFFEQ